MRGLGHGRDRFPGDEVVHVQLPIHCPGWPGALRLTSQAPTGTNSPLVHISLSSTRPWYLMLHSSWEMTLSEATLRTVLFPVSVVKGMGRREGPWEGSRAGLPDLEQSRPLHYALTFGLTPACNLTLGLWRHHILLRGQADQGHTVVQGYWSSAEMRALRA